jgi:hypothetical protein
MKLRNLAGSLALLIVLGFSLLASAVVWLYTTEYGIQRTIATVLIAFVGSGVSLMAYIVIKGNFRDDASALVVILVLILLILIPILSMFYSGKVTYSRFGLTVYGAIPIPFLDITVDPNGLLWFRDKTHFISVNEVRSLLAPDTEALIIGTGWEGRVKVDPAIYELAGVKLHVLRTPEAFDLFNRYVSEGRTVVLLAHSSC